MYQSIPINEIHARCIKGGRKDVQGDRIVAPLLTGEPAAGITMGTINAGDSKSGRIYHTLLASQISYWNPAVVTNLTMAVTSTAPADLVISMNSVNKTASKYLGRSFNIIDYTKKLARVLGLMTMISYMAIILFVWIYANFQGYLYFSAGEPILLIKYLEWVLGFIGIFAAVDLLQRELNDEVSHSADTVKNIRNWL